MGHGCLLACVSPAWMWTPPSIPVIWAPCVEAQRRRHSHFEIEFRGAWCWAPPAILSALQADPSRRSPRRRGRVFGLAAQALPGEGQCRGGTHAPISRGPVGARWAFGSWWWWQAFSHWVGSRTPVINNPGADPLLSNWDKNLAKYFLEASQKERSYFMGVVDRKESHAPAALVRFPVSAPKAKYSWGCGVPLNSAPDPGVSWAHSLVTCLFSTSLA